MKTVFISILVFLVGAVVLVNIPIQHLSLKELSLGAFTDVSSATQISNFPSIYNANLDLTVETTDYYATTTHAKISSLPSLTTAGSLATIGTITSGTWNGSTIGIGYGGTNITTYSTGDLLYASATNVLSKLVASSSGEVLTLSGGVPVWRDASINPAGNFTFTGEWTFDGGGSATTTFNRGVDIDADSDTPLILRAISYIFPSSGGSSGQILTTNGSTPQTLSWQTPTPVRYTFATTTSSAIGTNTTGTSTSFFTIPGGTVTSSSTIKFKGGISQCTNSSGGGTCTLYLRDSTGATIFSVGVSPDSGESSGAFTIDADVVFNNSVSSQTTIFTTAGVNQGTPSTSFGGVTSNTSSIDFSSDVTFAVVVNTNANTSGTMGRYSIIVER